MDFDSWLLAHAVKLNLRLQILEWPKEWGLGWVALAATVTIAGHDYCGFGVDDDANVATRKAVIEAIERCVAIYGGYTTSSGIAGHETKALAAAHAVAELIERDAFFCHYLTMSPFLIVDDCDNNPWWMSLQLQAAKRGVQLVCVRLCTPEPYTGAICIAFGERATKAFGATLGLGCADTWALALRQAAAECVSHLQQYLNTRQLEALNEEQFAHAQHLGAIAHSRLGFDRKSALIVRQLLAHDVRSTLRPASLMQVKLEHLKLPTKLPKDIPLRFIRATSAGLQTAYTGRLAPQSCHLDRLTAFCGKTLSFADLNHYPHILG